ncbi:MAG: pseudouridine-5'-phosphate glycosidase [Acidimicrobiales bacterium]|nr:pseudouridine-5'-phosphate glycosidase [Acidimicrobiales bacterium]
MTDDGPLRISDEVRAALSDGRPVVALESTIVTHGMPHPHNLETALSVEQTVRDRGAVPATIAIIEGKLVVGVAGGDLERLAWAGHAAAKASRRDVAAQVATGGTAGTTVATTMLIAAMAGIEVFATGGIGGVHRGAELTFDISADLLELASTPVTVVCAGAKSILDIPKTLEVLETNGVPVLGFGTDEFPAFFARSSGQRVDYRFDDADGVARLVATQRGLGLRAGVLVANPIPEADALDPEIIDAIIDDAVAEAEATGVEGKELTPFLLARIVERTDGASLVANIALVHNNAGVGADIAGALCALA